jgi:protein O-GlcNAc transferase
VAADLITQAISAAGNAIPTTYLGNLAWVRVQLGEAFEAERLVREALRFDPGIANSHNTLGNALYLQGRITEAAESWRHAFELDGTAAHALGNWANVLQETGQIREAMAAHKRATEIDPQPAAAWHNYLRDLGFLPDLDPVFVREEHEKWAETFLRSVNAGLIHKDHANPRDPERKLNVGLVSPDFRMHSVRYFIEPLLRHLDRETAPVAGFLLVFPSTCIRCSSGPAAAGEKPTDHLRIVQHLQQNQRCGAGRVGPDHDTGAGRASVH